MNQNFASNFLFQGVFNKNVNLRTETAKTVFFDLLSKFFQIVFYSETSVKHRLIGSFLRKHRFIKDRGAQFLDMNTVEFDSSYAQ